MSACQTKEERQNTKASTFAKHLLRHECESEPGFVCTCQTYHRSRQRCTHLLNTTQYFHFLSSKACRSSKQAKGSAKPEVKAATPKSDTIPPSTITTSSSSSSLTDVTRDDVIMMCAPPAKVMPERSTAQQSRVVPEMTSLPVDGCKQEEGGDDIRRKFAVTRLTGALSRMVARPPSTSEAPVKSPSFSALSDKKRGAIEADPKTFQFKDL